MILKMSLELIGADDKRVKRTLVEEDIYRTYAVAHQLENMFEEARNNFLDMLKNVELK